MLKKLKETLIGGSMQRHALLTDAQIMPTEEEFAESMAQRSQHAAVKDALTVFKREECAEGTV